MASLTEKTKCQHPFQQSSTDAIAVHKSRKRAYIAAESATLILVFIVFMHAYLPSWNTSRAFSKDPTLRNNSIILGSHEQPYVFFPNDLGLSNLHNPEEVRYPECGSTDRGMHYAIKFNVTDEFHFLDSSPAQDARGAIVVQRGPATQISDMEVEISIAYASPFVPDVSHEFDALANTLQLSYASSKCVQVNVVINLRPDTHKTVRGFSMTTEMLHLSMEWSLAWTVDNLFIHSAHGGVSFSGSNGAYDGMITHNVSVSSVTGEIFGYFVADGNLHLRNEAGTIGVFLIPRFHSDVPMMLESINATTVSGYLDVEMYVTGEPPKPADLWPMVPWTHTAHFYSDTGDVRAAIPMGRFTNYTSDTGDVAAILIPFGAADEHARSDFRTTSTRGDTYVHIYNTLQESLDDGNINPLLSLRSRHKVVNGDMRIRYPYSWYGELEGVVSNGKLKFDGSRLSNVEKGDGWVKAERGDGASFMESWVEDGNLDLKVGLGPY